jgi:hypothetical protein
MGEIGGVFCLFVSGMVVICFLLFGSVDMRVSSMASRATIPPRRGIDHSFTFSYMKVMFNPKYFTKPSHKQVVTITEA